MTLRRNKKNQHLYGVMTDKAMCATNASTGARLVAYFKCDTWPKRTAAGFLRFLIEKTGTVYVRDYDEFKEKFK